MKFSKYSILLSTLLVTHIFAQQVAIQQEQVQTRAVEFYGDAIVDKIISVYDGDTFRCDLAGYPAIIGENIGIRVAGIDTPEIRSKEPKLKELAYKARDCAGALLKSARTIILKNMQRGKYFRIVADVWCDDICLADYLIKKGLAKPYDGGTKPDWSQEAEA